MAGQFLRFRWASLQSQYLCTFKTDSDIQERLGHNPPNLYTLYSEIYAILTDTPSHLGKGGHSERLQLAFVRAKAVCRLRSFLTAVSLAPGRGFQLVTED